MITADDYMEDPATFDGDNDDDTARRVIQAIKSAEKEFREWNDVCDSIDDAYAGLYETNKILPTGFSDVRLDLFWASMEVLKPATYARPPKPVVAPLFNSNDQVKVVTAELLERVSYSALNMSHIQDVMIDVRDDLLFTNRGQMWTCYEADDGKQKIYIESVDRRDFLYEACRKWCEVGWVAKRSWLTLTEMKERFKPTYSKWKGFAKFSHPDSRTSSVPDYKVNDGKCGVWEVWHRADNRVYWVTENYHGLLDSDEPHLKLDGFFPCPRPAFGTLIRRTLIPSPDWQRYAPHFRKISSMTGRIYSLIECVKMAGFYQGGGDIEEAISAAFHSADDLVLTPVATFTPGQDAISWLPLGEVAAAISALIEGRRQLIEDYYQLSGISDIMRGATEANETLGAQQLKSQYGSVRVQSKVDELQRIAADTVKIIAEIASEKFSEKTLQDMAQMDLPTAADLKKRIKEIESAAKGEMEGLAQKFQQTMMQGQQQGEQTAPAQAQQMFEQAKQEVLQKYGAMLQEAEAHVPIDTVVELLRDNRARCFAFEIESDSTILTDELQEKSSRSEFLQAFTGAQQSVVSIASMGEEGAKLAGEILKFTMAPFRLDRQMNSAIDEFVKAAPKYAAQMAEQGGADQGAEALAEAEMEKAKAQMAKVEADSQLRQAELQQRMTQMQIDAQEKQAKMQLESQKIMQKSDEMAMKYEELQAKIDNIRADTMKKIADAGVAVDSQALDEFKSLADIELKQQQAVQQVQDKAIDRELGQVNRLEDREDAAINRAEDMDFQREQASQNSERV